LRDLRAYGRVSGVKTLPREIGWEEASKALSEKAERCDAIAELDHPAYPQGYFKGKAMGLRTAGDVIRRLCWSQPK
jgi:hypothetical protein